MHIEFGPIVDEIDAKSVQNVEYTTTSFLFKHFPQWFLFIFNKFKIAFVLMVLVYFTFAFLFNNVFNMPWLMNHMIIFLPILVILSFLGFHMDVQSNVGIMREDNFRNANSDNIFWSPQDLDDDIRDELEIPSVIDAMSIPSRHVSVNNVLAIMDLGISTGDIVYYTRHYNRDDSYIDDDFNDDSDGWRIGNGSGDDYKRHGRPYSAISLESHLPAMTILRKKLDALHLSRRGAIEMPDGTLDDLIIKNVRRGHDDKIVNALQKNDFGHRLDKLFSRYEEIVSMDIFPDMIIINWAYEIPANFESTKKLSAKVIPQYEMRINSMVELKHIVES